MTDQHSDWTAYIITTLVTAVGSMIGAIVFLAKLIETKYVTEIKELKVLFINLEITRKSELANQETKIEEQKIITTKCQEDREALAIRIARLESESNYLKQTAQSNEINSMKRTDLIKTRLEELENK